MFFFLVQSEQGDLFKITLEHDEDVVSYEHHFFLITSALFHIILVKVSSVGADD